MYAIYTHMHTLITACRLGGMQHLHELIFHAGVACEIHMYMCTTSVHMYYKLVCDPACPYGVNIPLGLSSPLDIILV